MFLLNIFFADYDLRILFGYKVFLGKLGLGNKSCCWEIVLQNIRMLFERSLRKDNSVVGNIKIENGSWEC